ncbi:hypothetical protein JXI42_06685 [bacterium]|nr:hypothetical protein [bacterium]
MRKILILVFILFIVVNTGAVPRLIPYQGKLTNTAGVAINGTRNIQFAIYRTPTAGPGIWNETHWNVQVTNGLFDVVLGSVSPMNLDLADGPYYLQVAVNGDALIPRQQLLTEFYAIRAIYADSVAHIDDAIMEGDSISLLTNDAGYITEADWDTLQAYSDTAHTHDFSDLTGAATDGQIPNDITIDFAALAGAVQWGDIINIPPDIDDGDDIDTFIARWGTLRDIPGDIADGDDLDTFIADWDSIRNMPADFADGNDASGDNDWVYDTGSGLTGAIYHTGQVGIGTTSPEYPLHVVGAPGGYAFHSEGNILVSSGIDFGSGFGTAGQVLMADGAGNCDWQNLATAGILELDDMRDVDTSGVVDGQVLKWVAIANEWRPSNDVGGPAGADNWGTQVVLHDASLLGDGTAAQNLGINWNTLKTHINNNINLTDLHNVDDAGVADGEVLAWIAAANEWRPMVIGPGGLGDNWGTQIIMSDASINGDGTAGDILGVNWDTLDAYRDTFMVLDDLKDVIAVPAAEDQVLGWNDDSGRWEPRTDNDADMDNELIDSLIWEPVDDALLKKNTLRVVEHSIEKDVIIPINRDSLADNIFDDIGDVDLTGLDSCNLVHWDGTKWVPQSTQEIFQSHVIADIGNVNSDAPVTGDVLEWNGTSWGPGTNIGSIVNTWQDHAGYLAPSVTDAVNFRVWDVDSPYAASIIENSATTGVWYGMYIDRRGAASSDGYGLCAYGGTAGGVVAGSEFCGIKGEASGGSVVYGVYGDGEVPGTGGTGYGVYGRGKDYGVYGYGTAAGSWGGYFNGKGYFSGRLGVGTNAPSAKLDVTDNQTSGPTAFFTNTSTTGGYGGINCKNDAANLLMVGIYSTGTATYANEAFLWHYNNYAIRFGTNNTERMRLTNGGDLCIGTANVWQDFNMNGTSVFSDDIFLRDGAVSSGDTLVRIYDDSDDGRIDIYQNNAIKLRLNGNGFSFFNGGNVGIGTSTSSTDRLYINGGTDNGIYISNAGRVGIGIYNPGLAGLSIINSDAGITIDNITNRGIDIHSCGGAGVYAESQGNFGVQGFGDDTYGGVWGYTNNHHDFNKSDDFGDWSGVYGESFGYGSYDGCGVFGRANQTWESYGFGVMGHGGYAGGSFDGGHNDIENSMMRTIHGSPGTRVITAHGYGVIATGGAIGTVQYGGCFGQVVKGDLVSSYIDGDAYHKGNSIELNDTGGEQFIASYHPISQEPTVYASGYGSLTNGQARVEFDDDFITLTSDNERPVVTVTPIGTCNGLCISGVDENGFSVLELAEGTSNVEFSWIAIGKKPPKPIETQLLDREIYRNMNDAFFTKHPEYDLKFSIQNGAFNFTRDENDNPPSEPLERGGPEREGEEGNN